MTYTLLETSGLDECQRTGVFEQPILLYLRSYFILPITTTHILLNRQQTLEARKGHLGSLVLSGESLRGTTPKGQTGPNARSTGSLVTTIHSPCPPDPPLLRPSFDVLCKSCIPPDSYTTRNKPSSSQNVMIFTTLFAMVLASLAPTVSAQLDANGPIRYDLEHNVTTIVGTWSTGSKAVVTGSGFANPAQMTFTYPKTTGVSYSFSDDGFYEIARYRFNGNGSEPTCITGVIGWVHGRYTLNANGSITMTPFEDGYQQIQDPCAAVSNFIESYPYREYYIGWRIFRDPTAGPKLHLFQFDGVPVAPQFLVSTTPNMLPTRNLRNTTTIARRSTSNAQDGLGPQLVTALVGATSLALMAMASLTL
ncbi:unnamed protein product [Cyclocybe aegerita]|uniref:Protein ROT1 n=1 Tax=Cyclocybe aegerita TaxID=1973307 RepID=A0A8S0XGC0_CYCAE|nr:unnamed protein product [Cyclocybe aegerita]